MANFPPLKNYLIYCLGKIIQRYDLSAPFLDVGCGIGDISEFLSLQGWAGKAIDISEQAILESRKRLEHSQVSVACASVFLENGEYETILAMDVLEHIDDDEGFLRKIATLLKKNGRLVLAVPSNKREWRWDDDFYGHVRRYDRDGIQSLLERTGFRLVLCLDFTFPFFWFMRRIYTTMTRPRQDPLESCGVRTQQSSGRNAWPEVGIFGAFFRNKWLWKPVFGLQYYLFRSFVGLGHEMIVLAAKEASPPGEARNEPYAK